MPELPEVETMVRGVRPGLTGRQIVRMRFCRCPCQPLTIRPSRRRLQQVVKDRVIESVDRLAKRIVVELDNQDFIVIEPRMTGLLLVNDPPTQQHRRIVWELAASRHGPESFEFWDRRGLGTVSLMNSDEFQQLNNRLGPDPLTMSDEDWLRQLARTHRPVKNALLDQSIVTGIGNIYASEILHRARISPETPAAGLSARRAEHLAAAAREILEAAIRCEGSTLGDGTYRNALNQDGSYQNHHRVYQKSDTICPTCRRGRIRKIIQAQRSTFFCPRCQRH